MSLSEVKETMHYCPKCQKTYEDDAPRFCLSDGARLLPASNSERSAGRISGVFTSIIGKATPIGKNEDKFASIPRFVKTEAAPLPLPNFQPPDADSITQDEDDLNLKDETRLEDELELELETPPLEMPVKPAARIVKPSEVPSGTASIGDRKTNPVGRAALSRENPRVLLGQTVKGRYFLVELLKEDESSISYLAEDKINAPKKAVVRVLTDEDEDDFNDSVYAEERVSLSHVNHPNITRVIDSGELPEGKPFIISEFVEADSIEDLLKKSGQVNALRAARIIRQAAYALSEVHQNAILHRDLKPENILLVISDNGAEQIKLTNFGASSSKLHKGNLAYKAPEILEGKPATFAGDIYSLAAIAYQMLTNRLPFQGESQKELTKAQRKGLPLRPTDIRSDVSPVIDTILEKAMASSPTERYPKARDFGDAFFNALMNSATQTEETEKSEETSLSAENTESPIPMPDAPFMFSDFKNAKTEIQDFGDDETETPKSINLERETKKTETDLAGVPLIDADYKNAPRTEIKPEETAKTSETKQTEDLWTRRSPEPPKTASRSWMLFSVLGLALLLAAVWAIWSYSLKRENEAESIAEARDAVQNAAQNQQPVVSPEANLVPNSSPATEDIEVPPLPRQISQPPDTVYFQNSKQNMKGDLLRNFLPFTLYYPKDWQVNAVKESSNADARGKFLDVSKNAPNGSLSEQMLVSYYDSRGTYKDDKARFPQLVKETNETLKKFIPSYQILSEGETVINGWKAYEMKFQGGGTTEDGEKMIVWGRRLFIPAMRPRMKSGYEITLLATSFAPDVKSVDDLGVNGELAAVLETFEPSQNF